MPGYFYSRNALLSQPIVVFTSSDKHLTMRKILLVLLFVLTAILGVYAQKKVSYGLKGGLNFSNHTGNFDNYRTGIYGGGFAEVKLNKRWAIQPEVVYYKNTGSGVFNYAHTLSESTTAAPMIKTTRKEHYISIPVMIKYYAAPKLYIEAGPELNYLAAATEQLEDHRYNVADQYNRTGLNLSLGAGYQLPCGFGINARYTVATHSREQTSTTYNNTGKVGLTYTINHK